MIQHQVFVVTVGRGGRARTSSRSARWMRGSIIGLGIVGALVVEGKGVAQAQGPARLTVRPREMATGTQNPDAGEYPLKSAQGVLVSVPKQCVGMHRCPLFIFLPGAGYGAREVTDWLRPAADKYGMLLLAPTEYETNIIDAALKETLQKFAIDPDKIAIIGRCASGNAGMRFGIDNLDVFSRIASVSGGVPTDGMDPKNKTAQFLFDEGVLESGDAVITAARALQRDGHPVKVVLTIRGHEHQTEDYDFLGRWLQESWATPNPAARPALSVVANPVPALTIEVLTQMTTFWTSFSGEPDSIRLTARRAHLREILIPIGSERPSLWMTDMPALAAKYPSVAADLKKAGLTAQQHEAYRIALISAQVTQGDWWAGGVVDSLSVLAKNVGFLNAHPDEFKTLSNTGIVESHLDDIKDPKARAQLIEAGFDPDVIKRMVPPSTVDSMGSRGIWRTP